MCIRFYNGIYTVALAGVIVAGEMFDVLPLLQIHTLAAYACGLAQGLKRSKWIWIK